MPVGTGKRVRSTANVWTSFLWQTIKMNRSDKQTYPRFMQQLLNLNRTVIMSPCNYICRQLGNIFFAPLLEIFFLLIQDKKITPASASIYFSCLIRADWKCDFFLNVSLVQVDFSQVMTNSLHQPFGRTESTAVSCIRNKLWYSNLINTTFKYLHLAGKR